MRFIKQALTVTIVGLYTIPQRLSSAVVAVIGVAGVVVVLVAVLSIAEGFKAAMVNAGRADRAVIMRDGADSEMSSGLAGPDVDVIKSAPGIKRDGTTSVASAEMFVVIDLNRRATNTAANVPLRGVDSTVMAVRHEAKIVEGRMLNFGTNEVVAGRAANRQFLGLNVGDSIRFDVGGASQMWQGTVVAYGSLANDTALEVDGMSVMTLLNQGSIAGVYHNRLRIGMALERAQRRHVLAGGAARVGVTRQRVRELLGGHQRIT